MIRVMKYFFPLMILLSVGSALNAQGDSCQLRISVLTCGPGEDLYSVFGHTAIRVVDPATHSDIIYNYGTFDFSDPDFYVKFVKGKLLYFVSVEPYESFMEEYRMDRRSVIEQVLRLNCSDHQNLAAALANNARPENRYYFYEFLFDNCSTRVRDIVRDHLATPPRFGNILPNPPQTFRTMLHACLDTGRQYWSELGIDLVLGSLIDRRPTNDEVMFLPDYLMKGFDSAYIGGQPAVSHKETVLRAAPPVPDNNFFKPLHVTVALLVLAGLLSFSRARAARRILDVFDVTLFFITGGIGCFLVFMWFGTEHDLTANNFNLLWAVPLHLPVSVVMLRRKRWIRQYFFFCTVLYLLLVVAWPLIPQGMNSALWPFTVLLGLRSYQRWRATDENRRRT